MILNSKNSTIKLNNTEMHYISFGYGSELLIMLPGLGDGISTVKGTSIPLAFMYREFAKYFKVYVFSRKNELPQNYTTKNMADDQAIAMNLLGLQNANILGISQGGMISQHLAINYPNLVKSLILTVTLSKQNEYVESVITNWIAMAKDNNYADLIIDTSEKSYSEAYLRKRRWMYPIISRIGKPKDFTRFIIQANSCITHDTSNDIHKIEAKTLVIGGNKDKIVGPHAAKEISDSIKNSELLIYDGLGHGAYEEATDFKDTVIKFFNRT